MWESAGALVNLPRRAQRAHDRRHAGTSPAAVYRPCLSHVARVMSSHLTNGEHYQPLCPGGPGRRWAAASRPACAAAAACGIRRGGWAPGEPRHALGRPPCQISSVLTSAAPDWVRSQHSHTLNSCSSAFCASIATSSSSALRAVHVLAVWRGGPRQLDLVPTTTRSASAVGNTWPQSDRQ